MRRANVGPDLSFLPVGTQQQLQNMIAYIQIQKEMRKLPRVDGIRIIRTGSAESSGVDVQLAVLKKNPIYCVGAEGRIEFAVRISPAFPAEAPLISCTSGAERLPLSLYQNGRLSMLHGGWQQGCNLRLLIKDLCSRLDGSKVSSECAFVQPLYDANVPLPTPSAPTLYSDIPGKDESRQMLFRCKWKETVKQFPVPMIRTLLELRQVIEPQIPAAMQPGISLKLLKSPQDAMLLKSDEVREDLLRLPEKKSELTLDVVRRMCVGFVPATCPLYIFSFKEKEQQSRRPIASVDLLELNRLSPKKSHGVLRDYPARLQLSPLTPVGSVDLLGLNNQSPKKLLEIAPPASPVRLQVRSQILTKILKPGCTVREVEWKDLAIQKQVGVGSSCQVYKGSWRGAEVAVKSFTGTDRSAVEREFANEVDMMQQLGPNPSLVLLLAVCATPLSIVLEYLPFSLFELINGVPDKMRRIPPFPTSWTKRVHMMLDIARGLQFLHSFDIIHRDLKSLNLLMTAEGRVKLADFGISRSNNQAELMTGCCGTFQWMAPEVLISQKYSLSADVYSFGVILWEICEGAAPFKDLAPAQISIAVVQERRRPIISPRTPPPLRDLIQRCWQHEPALRPTAADVVGILQSFFYNT